MELKQKMSLCGQIINKEKMISLMEIIRKYTDENQILNIKFNDDSEYANLSIHEFEEICFDNKLIEKMNIYVFSSYKHGYRNKFSFTYYRTDLDSEIEYSSNNRDQFLHIQDDIDKWKVSVTDRKWCSFIYKWYFYVIMFLIICASLSVFIYKLFCATSADSVVNVFLLLVQIIFYLFTIPCVKIIKHSFPKVELDIGINRHKKMRKILWVVISVIVIPFIISLLIK